jgi:hypothetical protein
MGSSNKEGGTSRLGTDPKFARRMYTSVALPRILYAANIWAPPSYLHEQKRKPTENSRFTMRLASIQRAGTLAIVGGLETSSTDTLCARGYSTSTSRARQSLP